MPENYFKNNVQNYSTGQFTTNSEHRITFLKSVMKSAQETMEWALDARLRYLTRKGLNSYDKLSGITQTYDSFLAWKNNAWNRIKSGPVAILSYRVREMAKNFIEKSVYEPVNVFLQSASLPLLRKYVDRKVFDTRTR